jgi:hypothetical protein
MDGSLMLKRLRQVLQEGSTSSFIDEKTSYDNLYEGACELVSELELLKDSQTITTVATQSLYDLNANYLSLFMRDDSNNYVLKYNNGTYDSWIPYRDYGFAYQNDDDDQSIPNSFSIIDKALPTNISSTATADGASSGGLCTLTDSTAPFATVSAGDSVHNTTDGSEGIVVSVTSTSAIVTSLFDGTNNDWTNADAYVIVPQGRKQLFLNPPSLTAGHTITFKYVCKPDPVYSDYGQYRVPSIYIPAVIKYAAWLYKYRDREPSYGDAWYKFWEMQLRKGKARENKVQRGQNFSVNMKKSSYTNRSMR